MSDLPPLMPADDLLKEQMNVMLDNLNKLALAQLDSIQKDVENLTRVLKQSNMDV